MKIAFCFVPCLLVMLFAGCRPLFVPAPTERPTRAPSPKPRVEAKAAKIASIQPTKLKAERGGTVTLIGEGFPEGMRVLVDGVPATKVVRASETEISFLAPRHEPGAATVTVILFPGTRQEERIRLENALEYLAPHERLHLHGTTRLIELPTGRILDARLLSFTEDYAPLDDRTRERMLERAGDALGGQLPVGEILPADDRVLVVCVPNAGNPQPKPVPLENALVASLRGRGIQVADAPTDADYKTPDDFADRVFYLNPLKAESFAELASRKRATKLLCYRIVAQAFEDVREGETDIQAALPEEVAFAETAAKTFEDIAGLARGLPESASSETTLLVRLAKTRTGEPQWDAVDFLIEDAVLKGVLERMPVIEKLNGPPAKPAWLHAFLDSPSDPLASSSWEAFRKAYPGVASVWFYRPSEEGVYGRLVDTASGGILWSGRLASPNEILAGDETENPHDRIYDLLSGTDWKARIPADATVWVAWDDRPKREGDSAASDEAYDGLLSVLTDAGIRVREPMVTAYRLPEPKDERVFLREPLRADPYRERAQSGVTHVLLCDAPPSQSESDGVWKFRLIDTKTGKEVGTWSVDGQ